MTNAGKPKKTVLFAALALVATMTVLFAAAVSAQQSTTSQDAQKTPVTTAAKNNFSKTSKKPQSGDRNVQAENAHITANNNPFRFKKTSRITSINKLIITATMRNGATASGDFDHNDLILALDGVNTGIKLNGFRAHHLDTRTNSGAPDHAKKLKKKLKKDGKLKATIIDRTSGDNHRVSLPANFQTKLTIKGKN